MFFSFLPCFYWDQVHAVSSTDVSSSNPINFQIFSQLILPWEEVIVAVEIRMLDSIDTIPWVWQTQCSIGLIEILAFHKAQNW